VSSDPRQTIANAPMSVLQIVVVGLTIGLNALDGFDVLAIAFASPGIRAEWGLGDSALGFVLAMELIGMAVGSLVLGGVADRIGRRKTILACVTVMAFGMYMATTTTSIVTLSVWRVITGLGIGGMLAAINAVAAEFSNAKSKYLSVSLMSIGYPLGGVFGGFIAAYLLKAHDWRSVFYFGSIVTAAFLPLIFLLVPESVHWLAKKQPAGALEKINRALGRMGHQPVAALPSLTTDERKQSIADIFSPALIRTTLLISITYFFHIMAFYYTIKWIPSIVTKQMGFTPVDGATILRWANVGGALGGAIVGLLTLRYGLKAISMTVLIGSAVMITVFGASKPDLTHLAIVCCVMGCFTNGAIVGLYAIFAKAFPTHVRATGTGFAIGTGRGGSAMGPPIAGALFTAGYSLQAVSAFLAVGCVLAAIALFFVKLSPQETVD
jgi:benzoate transport